MNSVDSMANAKIFNDLNGLNSLKVKARTDEDAALKEVARQFESMFVGMMLKSMREANDVMFEDNMSNSNESKFYRQMYDDQLALSLSTEGTGTGLADILYEQMRNQLPEHRITDVEQAIPVIPLSESDRPQVNRVRRSPSSAETNFVNPLDMDVSVGRAIESLKQNAAQSMPQVQTKTLDPLTFNSPEDFVAHLLPIAEKIGRKAGLDGKTILAQAALETGWGKHVMPSDKGGSSYNLFGVKAIRDWQGDVATHKTLEHDGHEFKPVTDAFRSYQNYEQSFEDYLNFLQSHPRYQTALRQGKDGNSFVNELQNAGYATDPNYASKIQKIASSKYFSADMKEALS